MSDTNPDKKKISVIVPVYNAQRTLERCVSSILNQTYPAMELILVDDASTDSSRQLMEELERRAPDKIMLVLCDENRGPGGARNAGLMYASGDYIGFVDSDDYISSSFYEKLVDELERGGFDYVDSGYYNESKDLSMLNTGRNERGMLTDAARRELIVSGGYLWSKLFRRELFFDYGIVFRENCILEDSEVLVKLIAYARSIGAVEETMYWYSKSADSASQKHSPASYLDNIYNAMSALARLEDELDNYRELKPAIDYEIIQMYNYGVVAALKDAQTDRELDTFAELERLRLLKQSGADTGYDNPYVRNKIDNADIDIMKHNDKDPKNLIRMVTGH
ncbi:MAG: glycosyltransferase family 2 protein [Lachnospiraceae bacterium]|nr:glycosyltransferase family 2 protein [Lachnospiraceae bacterium]